MILVGKWFFEMTVAVLCPNFESNLIVVKIRSAFVRLVLLVSMSVSTLCVLRVSESNVSFLAKFVWAYALCAIYTFMILCWDSL